MNTIQIRLGELEAELVEINANSEKLQRSYNELAEYKLVLHKVYLYFPISLIFMDLHTQLLPNIFVKSNLAQYVRNMN